MRDLNRSKIVKSDIETFLNGKVEIEFFQTDMHIASPVPAKHTGNNDNLILRIFFLIFIRPVFQYIAGLVQVLVHRSRPYRRLWRVSLLTSYD